MGPDLILLAIAMSIAGALAGTFTGLVPGIHVNTLASVMLILFPSLESMMSGFTDPSYAPILVSAFIMSASVVHSFVDFVPSVFIGAPDPDEALTVLPGHRLMMEGRGMEAVRAATVGSVVGATCSVLLAIPFQYLMLNGLADTLDMFTFAILLFVLCAIILNEKGIEEKVWGLILVLVSGGLGFICMNANIPSNGILGEGTLLFPLLTGLFGMPFLLHSVKNAKIPEQYDDGTDPVGVIPGLKGVLMGAIAGWYPGITATAGASLASIFSPERNPSRFISMVASIGTVTAIFSIVTLSVSGSGRSGTVLVIKEIVGDSLSGFCSPGFLIMLLSVAVATTLGYFITIGSGRIMVSLSAKVNTRLLNRFVLVLISTLVLLLTGPFGIMILAISTLVGMIPMDADTDRMPLTGCLILPVLIYKASFLGILP